MLFHRLLVGLYCLFSVVRLDAQTPAEWVSNPAWDWFGYTWEAEYGGNLFDESGECRGRIAWLDYNNIVAISQAFMPANNFHYNRVKGFGLGYEWVGKFYRDDSPADPIPLRWTFVPNGVTAWFDIRYDIPWENGPPTPIHLTGILVRRW